MCVSGWVTLVGSSQQQWALSLTLTLLRTQFPPGNVLRGFTPKAKRPACRRSGETTGRCNRWGAA